MNETLGTVAMLLPLAVQWLRAKKQIPEVATWAITAAIGVGAYWLYASGNPMTREFWQHAGVWVLTAMGVNQGASSLANMGLAAVPRTNSE
jgi:hypothetical protein